ncbi:metallophosphoesterase family protein [Sutcliffiella rhizosphaerae]|uniref:Serine/threonine-protein phosphatase 1 n=1 Tax=Sutcliffiella rhizosphaerae TaxID=2880967 RepID=A0ABM8YKD3_9BACI|nr:metallophosphoesterase family protein [Sutcliffiella rhizosphaerae]CAG9620321.1 Serine/threonine-protein phosphatase 1 [Sutcliffiella rhizosphaerae]
MRTIVISDIHGCYDEFCELLEQKSYQRGKDSLILLGDYMDRGEKSLEVLELVMELSECENVIVLGGNHEDIFLDWLAEPGYDPQSRLFRNGGMKTVESFCNPYNVSGENPLAKETILKHYPKHIEFLKSLPNYYEDSQYIYVHAGVDLSLKDWKETSRWDFRWLREKFWEQQNNTGKTIIFGHTPTPHLHKHPTFGTSTSNNDIWYHQDQDRICIDGGCVYGGKLNALILQDS